MSPHFTRVVKEVYGYEDVRYMVAGHKTWQATINPYYTEPEFLRMAQQHGLAHVLVDLRPAARAAAGHIAGAVNFPAETDLVAAAKALDAALEEAGIKKNARIIYYGDDDRVTRAFHDTMHANSWNNGYILNGGMAAWRAKGYPVDHGPLAAKPVYEGTTVLPGAMSMSEFEKIALHTPPDTVIIDTRSPAEWKKTGVVPGALLIPIDTLARRLDEVPRDKNIVVHCAAGNRALQVWRMLIDRGWDPAKVRWVDGKPHKSKKHILKKM